MLPYMCNMIVCSEILGSIQIYVPRIFFRNNHLFLKGFAKFPYISNLSLHKFYNFSKFLSSYLDIFSTPFPVFKAKRSELFRS